MALRNAFENLIIETVAGAVEAAITAMDERQARQALMEQPRDLQYARTVNDELRVAGTVTSLVNAANTTTSLNGAGIVRAPGDPNATFMVDERWQQMEQSMQTFIQTRTNRWGIT